MLNIYDVNDVIEEACDFFRVQNEDKKVRTQKEAMRKRVQRLLKDEWRRTPPGSKKKYALTKEEVERIVRIDLRDYFEKVLLDDEAQKKMQEARQKAKEDLQQQYDFLNDTYGGRSQLSEDLIRSQEEGGSDDYSSRSKDKIDRMMLRALFYKAFPKFDLDSFRLDYKEYEELSFYLSENYDFQVGNPDCWSKQTINAEMRFNELEKLVKPALEGYDLTPYLKDKESDDLSELDKGEQDLTPDLEDKEEDNG